MIALILATVLAGCPEDCSKVLIAQARAKQPTVEIHTVVQEPTPSDPVTIVKVCDDYDGIMVCSKETKHSAIQWSVTSEDL